MLHRPVHTTWTASRHAGVAPGGQYAASSCGAAFHLAQQAVLAVQVEEAGVPPVGQQGVLPGLLIDGEAGPAAAVLVNAQVRHRRCGLVQEGVRGGGERVVRGRPGDPGMPGRLGRGNPALADLVGGLLAQPGRDPAARRHGWHRLGERLARAPRVAAFAPYLTQRRCTV
jgi:hypothetical protein